MLSPELFQLSAVFLAAISVGLIIYIFVSPYLSGEKTTDKRIQNATQQAGRARGAGQKKEQSAKKRSVQQTLKDLDEQQKSIKQKKVTTRIRLLRAGIDVPTQSFIIVSVISGLIGGVLAYFTVFEKIPQFALYVAAAAAVSTGLGFPRWVINFLTKKRQKKFLEEFPNSIDVIVRGVKSGLPLNDCLNIIAKESAEPVKGEFVRICEQQRVGIPLAECLARMFDRLPMPEVSFFAISIGIQQQSGGNLAETMQNLSQVLRERKKLRGKVQAFSAEAKSSAAIIGALPVFVMLIVYVMTPSYISLLWTDEKGQLMLLASAVWMLCGVLVMRKMINFDY